MNTQNLPHLPGAVPTAAADGAQVDGLSTLLGSGRILPWRSLEGVSSSALSEKSYLTRSLADTIQASFGAKAPAWGDAWMAVLCGLHRVSRQHPQRQVQLPCAFRVWFQLAPTFLSVVEIPQHSSPDFERGYLFALAIQTPSP